MYIVKANFLNRYPVYFNVSGNDVDCVATLEEATTFNKKDDADKFAGSVSDYFTMNGEKHYSDIRVVKVKITEEDELQGVTRK